MRESLREEGGINRSSLVEYLGEEMTNELAKARPGLVNPHDKGTPLDRIALEEDIDYGRQITADELANDLYTRLVANRETPTRSAQRLANEMIDADERVADFDPGEEMLAGDSYGQYLEALEKAVRRVGREQDAEGRKVMSKEKTRREQAYRAEAKREVSEMSVRQLSEARYIAAVNKALAERVHRMRRGDYEGAVLALQQARYAFAMVQEVRAARKAVDAVREKLHNINKVKQGTCPSIQTEALRRIMYAFGFTSRARGNDADQDNKSLRELVHDSVDDNCVDVTPMFPDWLLNLENPDSRAKAMGEALDWNGLTPGDVQDVGNLADFLVHAARERNLKDNESLASRVKEVTDGAVESMSDMPTHYAPNRESLPGRLMTGFSSIDTLDWQCRKADGFQNVPGRKDGVMGTMERLIYQPLRRAVDAYHKRLAGTRAEMAPPLLTLLRSSKEWMKKYGKNGLNIRDEKGNVVPVPEAIRRANRDATKWTPEMVIALALNMGNEGNRERLRRSFGENENGQGGLTYDMVSLLPGDDAAATLFRLLPGTAEKVREGRARRDGLLSAGDWKAVQAVWNTLGAQWKDTQKAHREMYGFAPRGVEPGAFTVHIGDEEVVMAGAVRGAGAGRGQKKDGAAIPLRPGF